MLPKVFLTYSAGDEVLAEEIHKGLETSGVAVVTPTLKAYAGEFIWSAVADAIRGSDCVVALLTDAATKSAWVNQEIGLALSYDKALITVLESDVAWHPFLPTNVKPIRLNKEDPQATGHDIISALQALPKW